MSEKKKNRRDRFDGWYVEESDPMHKIMPYMLTNRTDNEAVLSETIDMTEVEKYIAEKNRDNPEFKYTFFHFIVAALAKTITLRPKMNRFYSGYRLYDRKELVFSFVVKKIFSDSGDESLARIVVDTDSEKSPIEQVYEKVKKAVYTIRQDNIDSTTDKMKILLKFPRPILKLIFGFLARMEYHGHYPKSMYYDDPYYSSVFISNLGSIRMHADYHHLANWGTNSIFIVIGEKGPTAFPQEDGTVQVRTGLRLGFTIDERIADGYYFSKSLKILRKLFENPSLIEEPITTPIEY